LICGFKTQTHANLWFEESLCEAASLFALQQVSKQWKISPPYPVWKNYFSEFFNYRRERMINSSIPENFQLDSWFQQNRNTLTRSPDLRKQNLWVAIKILPLLENSPLAAWSACEWLNSRNTQDLTFESYLSNWYDACPKQNQKNFVLEVCNLFSIEI